MKPCDKYWWTVPLFINNIVPVGPFEDKCLPFIWFIPALVQLSIFLPIIVYVYHKFSKQDESGRRKLTCVRIFFTLLVVGSLVVNFLVTYNAKNPGPLPFRITPSTIPNASVNKLNDINLGFYSEVYMQFYFHSTNYIFGIIFAVCYCRYRLEQRQESSQDVSRVTQIATFYRENAVLRYPGYMIGIVIIIAAIVWLYNFVADPES